MTTCETKRADDEGATRDLAQALTAEARPPWACGLDADAPIESADRCRDVLPELIVELI